MPNDRRLIDPTVTESTTYSVVTVVKVAPETLSGLAVKRPRRAANHASVAISHTVHNAFGTQGVIVAPCFLNLSVCRLAP